jgi:hypothetical protein
MTTVNKYRIYCNTESKWVETWAESEPTICPNNNGHTVNANSVQKLDSVSSQKVIIEEEIINVGVTATGGNYGCNSVVLGVSSADTIIYEDVSHPYPVGLMAANFYTEESMRGDCLEIIISPDTIIGAITENVDIGVTKTFSVSQTVIDNIKPGYLVGLFNGVNRESMGKCSSIDTLNNKITVTHALSDNNFSAASPTYVEIGIKMAAIECGPPQKFQLGMNSIGASHLEPNTTIRGVYHNRTGTAKNFYFYYEYFY